MSNATAVLVLGAAIPRGPKCLTLLIHLRCRTPVEFFLLPAIMDTSAGLWPRGVLTYLNVSEAAVANLSQTLLVTQQQVLQGFDYSGIYLKASLIDVTILTMFFGMPYLPQISKQTLNSTDSLRPGLFTVLTAVAAYILLYV